MSVSPKEKMARSKAFPCNGSHHLDVDIPTRVPLSHREAPGLETKYVQATPANAGDCNENEQNGETERSGSLSGHCWGRNTSP
jgi:hypothetical protein